MDIDTLRQVTSLRSLTDFGRGDINDTTWSTLVKVTYNRAVLVIEITDFVFKTHLGVEDDQLKHIKVLQQKVASETQSDLDVKARFVPSALPRIASQDHVQAVNSILPSNWQWLDMLAAGLPLSAHHLAVMLEEVYSPSSLAFKGPEWYPEHLKRHYHAFEEKCEASGLSELIPTVILNNRQRRSRGPPRKRLRSTPQEVQASSTAWRFSGHIQAQVNIVVKLSTIEGSWTSVSSEWIAWAIFMDKFNPGHPHFPVKEVHLATFMSFFDNSGSRVKYVQAVKKANTISGHSWISSEAIKLMSAGASKHAKRPVTSFIHGDKVGVITEKLVHMGKLQLAKLVTIAYTYQLRVPSEGIPLQVNKNINDNVDWHSHMYVNKDGSASIKLRRRKHKDSPSIITRFCICAVWPSKVVCGVCTIKNIVNEQRQDFKVFPDVKVSDINIIKDISFHNDLGYVTWHGFRRGRTEDIVAGLDVKNNPAASIRDIAESLGHHLGRASFFKYLGAKTSNVRRAVHQMCDDTDSD